MKPFWFIEKMQQKIKQISDAKKMPIRQKTSPCFTKKSPTGTKKNTATTTSKPQKTTSPLTTTHHQRSISGTPHQIFGNAKA